MTAEEVLAQVLEAGGRVILDPERPRLLVPPALKPLVETYRHDLRRVILSGSAPEPTPATLLCPEVLAGLPPEEVEAIVREIADALARIDQEIQTGRLGSDPIQIRSEPLAHWLSLDQLARLLQEGTRRLDRSRRREEVP